MHREVSASFQAVEDWLRSLGLIHYAQSFYDNGYEDIETCKLMKEQDLNVIGITNDQDRNDILGAIHKLQQNLYFELEPETEKIIERTKIDAIVLKTKLKEYLEREKIQLIEPPYYNADGSIGDLYPLAIRYAAELATFFDDVLNALEQLRKRQLPAQNYNLISAEEDLTSKVKKDQENRRSLRNISIPAEYLNVETLGCKSLRSSSFSKYDTRVTKSTTDLTKDNINVNEGSVVGSPKYKNKNKKSFLGNVFRKTNTARSIPPPTIKPQDFKASELQLSQDEIKNIFEQVKNKELSQEDALDVIKRHKLSKSTSFDGSPEVVHQGVFESNEGAHSIKGHTTAVLSKIKNSKSMKDPMRNRCASAQFYLKGGDNISQSLSSLISNDSKSSLEISSDYLGSAADDDTSSIESRNSPDMSKHSAGIFKKIRNSIRKKKSLENDSPCDDELMLQDGGKISTEEVDSLVAKIEPAGFSVTTISCEIDDYSHTSPGSFFQNTLIFPPPPNTPPPPPPPPPPPLDIGFDEQFNNSVFRGRTPSFKIKSYPLYQEEMAKRRAFEKNNNISKNGTIEVTDGVTSENCVDRAHLSFDDNVSQVALITELNKVLPKIPPRPPARLSSDEIYNFPGVLPQHSRVFRADITEKKMDELVKEMNDIEADLENHLQHVNDTRSSCMLAETQIAVKKLEPLLKMSTQAWKKPVPPPRPSLAASGESSFIDRSVESCSPTPSKGIISLVEGQSREKLSEKVSNRQWVAKKLNKEVINLSLLPYTSKSGGWCIPYNLVLRYTYDLALPVDEVLKCFEEIRIEERKRMHQPFVPFSEKDLNKDKPGFFQTVDDFLVHIGLPMYVEDFRELGIKNISGIYNLDDSDIRRVGIFDSSHVNWLLREAKALLSP